MFYIVLQFAGFCGQTEGARILVASLPIRSHSLYVNAAAEELAVKGHDVYTIQPPYWDEPKALISTMHVYYSLVIEGSLCLCFSYNALVQYKNTYATKFCIPPYIALHISNEFNSEDDQFCINNFT